MLPQQPFEMPDPLEPDELLDDEGEREELLELEELERDELELELELELEDELRLDELLLEELLLLQLLPRSIVTFNWQGVPS